MDKSKAKAEPIQQTVDRSTTTISLPAIAARPQRVSPLAASWQFGIQTAPVSLPPPASGLGAGWWLAGVGLLIGAGALYMAFRG